MCLHMLKSLTLASAFRQGIPERQPSSVERQLKPLPARVRGRRGNARAVRRRVPVRARSHGPRTSREPESQGIRQLSPSRFSETGAWPQECGPRQIGPHGVHVGPDRKRVMNAVDGARIGGDVAGCIARLHHGLHRMRPEGRDVPEPPHLQASDGDIDILLHREGLSGSRGITPPAGCRRTDLGR